MSFMELSRNLDHPGAIYGLEFPYRNHAGNPVQTVEEIADLFNEAIARITPPQNVHLMGYSFGGLVAYEMARQLQLRHLQVRSLILLDSFLPSAVRPRNPLARLGIHARRAWRHGFGAKAVRMFEKDASFANGAATQEYRSLRPNGAEIDRLTRRAFDTYRPGTYKGDLIFIHPMEISEWLEFCIVDPSGGWRSTALGNIRNIPTPGNHLSMLHKLHIDDLARILDSCFSSSVATNTGQYAPL
ncbi:MAG TPA: alpha/beta fold hydrolase [Tepidisphaeraceae bacterium]|jgi:thioesterase domain-containing protein